jgi:hypothetical protein
LYFICIIFIKVIDLQWWTCVKVLSSNLLFGGEFSHFECFVCLLDDVDTWNAREEGESAT